MTPTTDPRPIEAESTYWRSASELAATPEFRDLLEREFPVGAAEGPADVSRRGFLTAVAASVAAATMTSCRKPVQRIMPFNQRPEFLIPGVPLHYATALTVGGYGVGLLVRSNEGRPTKIEGNPEHPASLGGTTAFLQGELLTLYDPARSTEPVGPAGGQGSARARFQDFMLARRAAAAQTRGKGLHLLLDRSASPTLARVVAEFRKAFPQATVHRYAPVGAEREVQGAAAAFGRPVDSQIAFDACAVVAAFDADFLGVDGDVRASKLWAKARKITAPGTEISRLYAVEGAYTVTGASADHRFRVAPSQIPVALFALAAELGVGGDSALGKALSGFKGKVFSYKGKPNWIPALARDLTASSGRSAVVVGPRQPAAAHAVAHAINAHLGNHGKTVTFTKTPEALADTRGLTALAQALGAGEVDTVVAIGCNPAYDAPADLDFAAKWAKAKHTVHVGLHRDETALASTWHANLAHELEAWGDAVSRDGTLTIQQPLIAPLWNGISAIEAVALLTGTEQQHGHELVRATCEAHARTDDFDAWWAKVLHDGHVAGTAAKPESVSIDLGSIARAVGEWQNAPAPSASSIEVEIRPDSSVHDGRYANNPWMQELPDPITKLTWDNAVWLSRTTAESLGAGNGDVLSIAHGGRTVEGPAWIVPGHADWVLTVHLGYGRRMDERCEVAAGAGFDAYPLRTAASPFAASGVKVAKTGRTHELVSSQDHGSMEGRPLYREATVSKFNENPTFAPGQSPLAKTAKMKSEVHAAHGAEHGGDTEHSHAHEPKTEQSLLKSLWKERDYTQGYQWGMVIDLNSCNGCNACVVACVSENNISMVGKGEVASGREMHWIRLDRYFSTDATDEHGEPKDPMLDDEPGIAQQPVPCMQCENAPCESVCPVAATVHSPEGLNDMAYNRCIGTRYCNNNCPYKVRRFNWFNFNQDVPKTRQMAFNPNVTVRARGVMEKCTYCVQRINAAKIDANKEDRKVRDGEIVPACAQGCPSDAITFGDINDPSSRVSKLRSSPLNYSMLSEMNLKPRTTYLAKVSNPNPELVG